ncbi:tRNA-dihydrouridine(20/20a) synthase [Nosema granulosis]|uniref:tRNA-dihydrouridine(20/20a) synthase n=1 Tax=Nosema granulosis TaxID=83296 RepID=A0A9P6KYS4_9MICR|nr:tRNA-dihydrouridine(20/20a) synthase [Nosema granulosis]
MSFEIALAPMIDVTTANYRKLVRMSSKTVVMFTEMIVSSTVVHIAEDKLLERLGEYDDNTVVQVGGSDPIEISRAIEILRKLGYTMFNLNVGCPSSRVQKGCFGAVLMKDKCLVGRIVNQVYQDTGIILSLKIRTGVDELDTYDFFKDFVEYIVNGTPASVFYVHARKCWLKGLSPKQNRNVPELNYDFVHRIKSEMPNIKFILNGGIKTFEDVFKHSNLDGVMIGRAAIDDIFIFYKLERSLELSKVGDKTECSLGYKDDNDNFLYNINTITKYLISFGPSTSLNYKIIMPLQNIMFGRKGCKQYKIELAEQLKRKVTVSEFLFNIYSFIY